MALNNHIYHRKYIMTMKNKSCDLIIFPAPVINIDWESKCGSNWKEKDRGLFMVSLYLNAEWALGKVLRRIIGQQVKQLLLSFDLTLLKALIWDDSTGTKKEQQTFCLTTNIAVHTRGIWCWNSSQVICHPDWIFVISFRTSRKMSGEYPKFRQSVLICTLYN